ncbi:NUDIX hydrolase [Agromyces sp. Marseille-P2726]|uniref:NUDIX hydrolase n=1 Tax=Agromyces sp. Marseille-P2726 TaxID=2709132 RepID=UPI00156F6211|nr:NUDIX hydrolase [Agromyces sp. Marseille-P2726]
MDIRVAAYGVIIRDGMILLSHWNQHGRSGWTLPGGGIEGAEHPVQAAKREILEETGYEASVDRLLGIDTMVVPAPRRHAASVPLYAIRIVYRASVVAGELHSEVGGSSDEARWFPLGDVPSLKRVSLLDIALRMNAAEPADGVAPPAPRTADETDSSLMANGDDDSAGT